MAIYDIKIINKLLESEPQSSISGQEEGTKRERKAFRVKIILGENCVKLTFEEKDD